MFPARLLDKNDIVRARLLFKSVRSRLSTVLTSPHFKCLINFFPPASANRASIAHVLTSGPPPCLERSLISCHHGQVESRSEDHPRG